MSILGKLMDSMRLNDTDDDDYYLDDDYEDESDKPAKRTLFSKKRMKRITTRKRTSLIKSLVSYPGPLK